MSTAELSLNSVLRDCEKRLAQAGIESARHDSEVLVSFVLDAERSAIRTWLALDVSLTQEQVDAVLVLVDRRAQRVPLQHITGTAAFATIELSVGPGVFTPRPESELLVERANAHLRELVDPLVVDLCSGSGAIGLAIAQMNPTARVELVELDDDAYLWLQKNVELLNFGSRVRAHHADAVLALPELESAVDVVVCNPPYVPLGATIRDREVLDFDPPLALWGGSDGLEVIRGIQANAARLLKPGGLVVIEHADVQGESLPLLLASARNASGAAWSQIMDHRDFNDRPRYTTAVAS